MNVFWWEMRFAARALVKRPGFSAAAILTLALALGSTTVIFSFVDGVLLQPLPYADPGRLVAVWEVDERQDPVQWRNPVSPGNFADWKEHNDVFATIAAFGLTQVTSLEVTSPERIRAGLVTDGFFEVLGAQAHLGRTFTPDEDLPGSNSVVLLSHGFWQRTYGGDETVIGKDLLLARGSSLIVGVMAPEFDFLEKNVELWAPRGLGPRDFGNRRSHFLRVIARLEEGVAVEEAEAAMQVLAAGIRESHPDWMTGWSVHVVPLEEELVGGVRQALLSLMAAAGVLLLIACVNVANLSLVRNAARGRELAIRSAIGANPGHLLRASLSESFLLALVGGGFGVTLAVAGREALVALAPENLPRVAEVAIDSRVLAFGMIVSFGTALVFGLGPALRAARFAGEASQGRLDARFRGSLVAAEVALSFCLVLGALLLSSTMLNLVNQPPGFERENVLTWRASLPRLRYPGIAKQNDFYRRVLSELRRQPGVTASGMTRYLPLDGEQSTWDFLVEGRPMEDAGERLDVALQPVSQDYFSAMGLRIVAGRGFGSADRSDSLPVIVVNETLAHRFFPGENPVGKRGRIFDPDNPLREIVGVVADVRHAGLDTPPQPTMYPPQDQMHIGMGHEMTFVIRSSSDPLALSAVVRRVFREIDQEVPVSEMRTMDEVVSRWVATRRFVMILVGLFAGAAVLLSVVGMYGVISSTVNSRRREIGLRVALGAMPSSIRFSVLRQGVGIAGLGIGLGAVGALIGGRLVSSLLFGVSYADPFSYVAVALLLVTVAAGSSYLPARRAARVDPMRVLREE